MRIQILFLSAVLLCLNVTVGMAAGAPPVAESQPAAVSQPEDVNKAKDENGGAVEQYLERKGESLDKKMENVMKPMQKGMEGIRGTTNPKDEGSDTQEHK